MEFYITKKAWKKVIDYAQASYNKFSSEIGGFMIMKQDKEGDYILSEPEILKQTVTGGTTEMEKEEVADYYVKAAEKHGNDIRFVWWHSHADMKAFWSGTDTSTMEEYSGSDWAAFLVVNIRGEHKFSVKMWKPIDVLEDVELNILGQTVPKSITDEVEKLCSKPEVQTYTRTRQYGRNQLALAGMGSGWSMQDQLEVQSYNDSYSEAYGLNNLYSYAGNINPDVLKILKEISDAIEELNDNYTEGTINYKKWISSVKSLNRNLKKDKVSFSIYEVTKNKLDNHVGNYTMYDAKNFVNYGGNNESNIKV